MATVCGARRALASLLAGKPARVLNGSADPRTSRRQGLISIANTTKYSSYANSPFVRRIEEQYEFDVVKNPPEWEYVERLLPFDSIPVVTPKENYPSGWIPPREEARNLPYFMTRTKNHELPVYLNITFRGMRKITKIKKIDGDIWLFNDVIKAHLKETTGKYVETRVHELGKFIDVKGDYVEVIRDWAHSKGF